MSRALINRALCGFLGNNSAILRNAAVQRYLPERLRARVNAFDGMLYTAVSSVLVLAVGALGEWLDYRLCVTICGAFAMLACWILIWGGRKQIRPIFEQAASEEPTVSETDAAEQTEE